MSYKAFSPVEGELIVKQKQYMYQTVMYLFLLLSWTF